MSHDGIKLNTRQNIAYNLMADRKNVFITGPGGVGKSALIKIFKRNYQYSRIISVTSTTGTSALLLNGTTIHSFLGIGTGSGSMESIVMKINSWAWLRKRWLTLECLIIDEISMLDPDLFDKLEHVARFVRKNEAPFGGIQLIISGDFLQLPCIGTDNFCFQAKSWDKCITHTVYLNEIIRQDNQIFQDCLNNIRVGNITSDVKRILSSRKGVFDKNVFGIRPTKLYSNNADVDRINNIELDKLASDDRQYYEYNMEINMGKGVSNKAAAIAKFKKHCNAQETVQLCVDAQVMLLKNLDFESGLVNGSRGIVVDFVQDVPMVRFLNGVERVIDLNVWEVKEDEKCIMWVQQIPLKVAYAISIHKSQGCSLDCTEIDLSSIFEYGQAYVALSRVKSLEGLTIIDVNFDKIRAHPVAVEYYEGLEQ